MLKVRFLRSIFIQRRTILHGTTFRMTGGGDQTSAAARLAFVSYEGVVNNEKSNPPPLIIMHGLFGCKANWSNMGRALLQHTTPQRKVYTVDARNHGDSPHHAQHTYEALAYDVLQLIKTERLGPQVALLGHSMGAKALILFAIRWPHLVERLIAVDTAPVPRPATAITHLLQLLRVMQQLPNKLDRTVPITRGRRQADSLLCRHITNRGVRRFILTNLIREIGGGYKWRVNTRHLLDNCTQVLGFPQLNNVSRYKGPTVFVVGGNSTQIQPSDQITIKDMFPNVEFKIVPNAGHFLHSERPEHLLRISLEFLNRPSITK